MKSLLIGFLLAFFLLQDQTSMQSKIIGDWKGIDKVMVEKGDTVDYTLDQKGYQNDDQLSFKENGDLIVFPSTKTTYEIADRQLRMGNRLYVIEKLEDNHLILSINAMGPETRFFLKFEKLNPKQ